MLHMLAIIFQTVEVVSLFSMRSYAEYVIQKMNVYECNGKNIFTR